MSWLWFLIPDEALPLIIIGVGFLLMLGLISGRVALGVLVLVLMLPILSQLVEGLLGQLPPWVSLLILVWVGLVILRGLTSLLIGRQAADHMIGELAADMVRLAFLILIFPLRLFWWIFRTAIGGNGR